MNDWRGEVPDRWASRVAALAAFVPPGSSVLDVGAGAQGLRSHLVNCRYTPADLVARTPDTVVLDLNSPTGWPRGRWDVAVCSGSLEYAEEPDLVLRKLHRLARRLVLSYSHRDRRTPFMNRLSTAQLRRLGHQAGYRSVQIVGAWREPDGLKHLLWELT